MLNNRVCNALGGMTVAVGACCLRHALICTAVGQKKLGLTDNIRPVNAAEPHRARFDRLGAFGLTPQKQDGLTQRRDCIPKHLLYLMMSQKF